MNTYTVNDKLLTFESYFIFSACFNLDSYSSFQLIELRAKKRSHSSCDSEGRIASFEPPGSNRKDPKSTTHTVAKSKILFLRVQEYLSACLQQCKYCTWWGTDLTSRVYPAEGGWCWLTVWLYDHNKEPYADVLKGDELQNRACVLLPIAQEGLNGVNQFPKAARIFPSRKDHLPLFDSMRTCLSKTVCSVNKLFLWKMLLKPTKLGSW